MGKIENFNAYKLCTSPYCSKEYTHFIPLDIRMDGQRQTVAMILLCEEHYFQVIGLKRLFYGEVNI